MGFELGCSDSCVSCPIPGGDGDHSPSIWVMMVPMSPSMREMMVPMSPSIREIVPMSPSIRMMMVPMSPSIREMRVPMSPSLRQQNWGCILLPDVGISLEDLVLWDSSKFSHLHGTTLDYPNFMSFSPGKSFRSRLLHEMLITPAFRQGVNLI